MPVAAGWIAQVLRSGWLTLMATATICMRRQNNKRTQN